MALPSLFRVPWGRFPRLVGVGSEEAPRGAGLRPPPKLDVQFSRIQLSQRLDISLKPKKE